MRRNNRRVDTIGVRYGSLTVVSEGRAFIRGSNQKVCHCQCSCGRSHTILKTLLLSGSQQSCGCVRNHGDSHQGKHGRPPRMYTVWRSMKSRCNCPSASGFHNYGGRGITVSPRWMKYRQFRADVLDMLHFMVMPFATDIPRHLDIDRINNDGDYELGNVRFVTRSQNTSNRRGNVLLTMNGETKTRTEWCRLFGVPQSRVTYRMQKRGWDFERALLAEKEEHGSWRRKQAS